MVDFRHGQETYDVTPACGVKRVLGFLYHQEGKRQNPARSHLHLAPLPPVHGRGDPEQPHLDFSPHTPQEHLAIAMA